MHDSDTDKQDQAIQALLREYPVPDAAAGFYDRALARATWKGQRRQRNRWMLAGFGSAIAAGFVLWAIGIAFVAPVDAPSQMPAVTMTLEEPRTVNLVFASAEALDAATLTVTLPAGIELAGFAGQREVTWETSLASGRNLLPLKLIATSPLGGEVLATLEHDDRGRTFRLRVDVG